MRRFLHTFVLLVWGLWFGGMIVLFVAVQSLFKTFADRHDLAGEAAAHVFRIFNAYQLGLAAAALLLTFLWRVIEPGKLKSVIFSFFAVATVGACVITICLAPRIEMLQQHGAVATAQFRLLHGLSMAVYLGESVALLIAGAILPWAEARSAQPRKDQA